MTDVLNEAEVGELIEGPSLMKGLDMKEPVLLAVTGRSKQGVLSGELSWMGVRLGAVAGKQKNGGGVTWARY